MAEQALAFIKEAEEESKSISDKALMDAEQMIADANHKAEQDIAGTEEQCAASVEQAKRSATDKAVQAQQVFQSETNRLCEELKQSLLQNKDKAVDAVMRAISGE